MQDFHKTINTTAGELYAFGFDTSLNSCIEIGYYDKDGNMIPVAALEVKTKEMSPEIDENKIYRSIYNPKDVEDYESVVINN